METTDVFGIHDVVEMLQQVVRGFQRACGVKKY